MTRLLLFLFNLCLFSLILSCSLDKEDSRLEGERKLWHKLTLRLEGPLASETGTPNPFLDYRMEVNFTGPDGQSYRVPGYFAADGNAAHSGATEGTIWKAHFSADQVGEWKWGASFRSGKDIAIDATQIGEALAFDGANGTFTISATDKVGPDFRARGRLQTTNGHFLRFAGNGEYFVKQGTDSPENILAYAEFDGPFATDGHKDKYIKTWEPHLMDWKEGDPTWAEGKGKGIIGALNYLASEGLNAFSFLTLNIEGDDGNVFPYLDYDERVRFDVSRLDQWEIVFEHAQKLGLFLHFKTQETENETLLDQGEVGTQRRLYYRELIARFGHHLALNWNLGEENGPKGKRKGQNDSQRKAMAQYFHENDPYAHLTVLHTYPDKTNEIYTPLLGQNSTLTGVSLQTFKVDFSVVHERVHQWISRSAEAGHPWPVACDEPGNATNGLRPDLDAGDSQHNGRKNALWGTLLAGGWGNEWYFGYKHAHSDLTCEDFRSRDAWWDYCRYALEFFQLAKIPYWDMSNDNDAISNEDDYCLKKEGEAYVIYLKEGGSTELNLSGIEKEFSVQWFDPRQGGSLQKGSTGKIKGGHQVSIGSPPSSPDQDWVVLVK
ncbi:MAG: DUF5060 domain-containing protein [Verrucomicrobiota bacterium]